MARVPQTGLHNCVGERFLTRFYLFRHRRLGVMLHWFERSDEDLELHDHPWSFVSVILWRGYVEHYEVSQTCAACQGNGVVRHTAAAIACRRCDATGEDYRRVRKRRWPLTILWRRAEWRHRVELVKERPALTLVIRFRERRQWGFWSQGEGRRFMPWKGFWEKKCGN